MPCGVDTVGVRCESSVCIGFRVYMVSCSAVRPESLHLARVPVYRRPDTSGYPGARARAAAYGRRRARGSGGRGSQTERMPGRYAVPRYLRGSRGIAFWIVGFLDSHHVLHTMELLTL